VKCAIQAQPDSSAFPPAGGTATVRVSTNRECQWSARSDATWLTLASPADGQGDGSFRFTVVSNVDPSSRTGDIAVNDQRLAISQEGKPCEFTLSSTHEVLDGAGGDRSIDVRASAAQCAWTAAANAAWITILSGREGRGNGSISFHVDAVIGPPRVGAVTIAGQTVQIEQGTGCSYAIAADTFLLDASGGERQIPVTAPPGCNWTAESRTSWIAIASGSSGSGSAAVSFRVGATDGPERSGTLIVAGHPVTITQGQGCTFAVSPTSLDIAPAGGPSLIQVQSGSGCGWLAASATPWISVTGGANGNGSGPVQIAVAANTGPARNGSVTVAGRTVTIAQANGCTYSVTSTPQDVAPAGGSVSPAIATGQGCPWTASSSADWITTTTTSGSGPAQIAFSIASNSGPPRSGTITVAGQVLTIAQSSACTWTFAPASTDLPREGGAGNVLVILAGVCTWTTTTTTDWIQLTAGSSGTGNGLVQFLVGPNPGAARMGSLTIAGQQYVVRQAGQ
jgi:Viral BACON domain/Putative binding domain, N-terminal